MTRLEQLIKLNTLLLEKLPEYRVQAKAFAKNEAEQWRLFRSLVNLKEPGEISDEFISLQNSFLQNEIASRGITDYKNLSPIAAGIYLWRGDITSLKADAIVNAANSGMTGCYQPCHACIDNAVHTYAGIQLRNYCAEIMSKQGYEEPTGEAKITPAFNLPCKYILHTVGPIVQGELEQHHLEQLKACYQSCMRLADENGIRSIAFCCISTGVFRFPNSAAAQIAVETVKEYMNETANNMEVVFNVFKAEDEQIYRRLLQRN